jgi:hypothetical protein
MANGLQINLKKCVFGKESIDFLGHNVSSASVCPLQDRVEALINFKTPTTVSAMQRFLGMVNYYHRFVPHLATILKPLYSLIKSCRPNSTIELGEDLIKSFLKAKKSLSQASLLTFPDSAAPLALTTDASDDAVGAVLEQWKNNCWQPLAFFSRQL